MGDLVYLKSTTMPSHLQEKWRISLLGTCSKSKTGSPTKDLSISSYRTNKAKISCFPRIPEDRDTPMEIPRA
jgi:hypothetical protein